MICMRSSLSNATDWHRLIIFFLVSLRAGQKRSRCSREPISWPVQVGIEQIPALLFVQCLESLSVIYRPDSILAWITAFWISKGLDPHVDQSGCGLVKDMNSALKYFREFSLKLAASARRWVSQKSITLDFTRFLYVAFVVGYCSSVSGEEMSYLRHRSLIWRNQEPDESFADVSW